MYIILVDKTYFSFTVIAKVVKMIVWMEVEYCQFRARPDHENRMVRKVPNYHCHPAFWSVL